MSWFAECGSMFNLPGGEEGFHPKRIAAIVSCPLALSRHAGLPVGVQPTTTRYSFPPRYLATKPVGLEIMRIEAAQNRSWQSKMTYGRFYMVGAHGNPSPGVHQYQRAVSWGSYCWQAAPDMKTRPAGIGNVHADWMGSLPSKLSAMPLKHLAVPGESTKRKDI